MLSRILKTARRRLCLLARCLRNREVESGQGALEYVGMLIVVSITIVAFIKFHVVVALVNLIRRFGVWIFGQ